MNSTLLNFCILREVHGLNTSVIQIHYVQEPPELSPITLQQESIVFVSSLKKTSIAYVDLIQSNPDTIYSMNAGGLTIIGTLPISQFVSFLEFNPNAFSFRESIT